MKKLLLVLLCLLCVSACSTRLAYNFMGFVSKWYIGTYVSLSREQTRLVDQSISDFKHWHRRTQLPLYADYLDQVLTRLQQGKISGEWIHQQTDDVQVLLDHSVNHLMPQITALVMSLSDQQAQMLLDKLADKRQKYRKHYVDIKEKKRLKLRINDISDHLGPFFGRLTSTQKQWIREWAQTLKPYEALTLEQQRTWATKVAAALAVRDQQHILQQQLNAIVVYRTDDWDAQLQQTLDFNQQITYALLARLVNDQHERQRRRLLTKLKSYRQDFLHLMTRDQG